VVLYVFRLYLNIKSLDISLKFILSLKKIPRRMILKKESLYILFVAISSIKLAESLTCPAVITVNTTLLSVTGDVLAKSCNKTICGLALNIPPTCIGVVCPPSSCGTYTCVGGKCVLNSTITGCCVVNSDCNDGNICTTDTCVSGKCQNVFSGCMGDYNCPQNQVCQNCACVTLLSLGFPSLGIEGTGKNYIFHSLKNSFREGFLPVANWAADQSSIGTNAHAEGQGTMATGDQSHAEGINTRSSGQSSHAEGDSCFSHGNSAHCEGINTNAHGDGSHSEGKGTSAGGLYSHAEGTNTLAPVENSHAEGESSTASGLTSHAEGLSTLSSGQNSHTEGWLTTAAGLASHAGGYNTVASGDYSYSEGWLTNTGSTASHVEGWSNIITSAGGYSHCEGINNRITAQVAHVEGEQSRANGADSHAEGFISLTNGFASHAEGQRGTANGVASHVQGTSNVANGDNSHSEGNFNNAFGTNSHAEGSNNLAYGLISHVEGADNLAYGILSHTEGQNNVMNGSTAHVEGWSNFVSGYAAHSEGEQGVALGRGAHSEGNNAFAGGDWSHAEGVSTNTFGEASHAEGDSTFSYTRGSHAEGVASTALGIASHAEGSATQTNGLYSHAEGYLSFTNDSAAAAHAEGYGTQAMSKYCHAEGYFTQCTIEGSHIMGIYGNTKNTNPLYAYSWQLAGGDTISSGTSLEAGISAIIYTTVAGDNPVGNGITDAWLASSADYAEYFEWNDGNTEREDRIGYFVALNGTKIILAQSTEDVIGITSGTSGITMDTAQLHWKGANLQDEFGRIQTRMSYFEGIFRLYGGLYSQISPFTIQFILDHDNSTFLPQIWTLLQIDFVTIIQNVEIPRNIFDFLTSTGVNVTENISLILNTQHGFQVLFSLKPLIPADVYGMLVDYYSSRLSILLAQFNYVGTVHVTSQHDLDLVIADVLNVCRYNILTIAPVKMTISSSQYDPNLTYIPRSERIEWIPVGMLGKIYVRDDGTTQVGQKCDCVDGIAVSGNTWRVLERTGPNVVRILFHL
jgi:trimeric autotransporter adhesin